MGYTYYNQRTIESDPDRLHRKIAAAKCVAAFRPTHR